MDVDARRATARTLAAAVLALAAIIGLSRIYVGVHWPSDVIGGFLLGASAILFARRLPF